MANNKIEYSGNSGVSIVCTITSLGNGSSRASTLVDNSVNKYKDALVRIKTNGQAGSTGVVNVFVYASVDITTPVYSDGVTGSDASFTTANIKNSELLAVINMNGATSVTTKPLSVASKFGGRLPPKWGIIVNNESGAGLSTTAGDHSIVYLGTYETIV